MLLDKQYDLILGLGAPVHVHKSCENAAYSFIRIRLTGFLVRIL